jgi:hypothetical protein
MNDDLEKLKNLFMPLDSIFYEDLSEADQWFLMARAFIDCSKNLFSHMKDETLDRTYFNAIVAFDIFNHSLELFLKGGIIQAGGELSNTHNLQCLRDQFINLYPEKEFEFVGDISNATRPDPQTPTNQFSRYPTNLSGQPFHIKTFIGIVTIYRQVLLFSNDYERLWPLMKQRY